MLWADVLFAFTATNGFLVDSMGFTIYTFDFLSGNFYSASVSSNMMSGPRSTSSLYTVSADSMVP